MTQVLVISSSHSARAGVATLRASGLVLEGTGSDRCLELGAVMNTEHAGVLMIYSGADRNEGKPLVLSPSMGSLLLFEPVVPLRIQPDGVVQAVTEKEWLKATGLSRDGVDAATATLSSQLLGVEEILEDEPVKTDEPPDIQEDLNDDASSDDRDTVISGLQDDGEKEIFVPDFDAYIEEDDLLDD